MEPLRRLPSNFVPMVLVAIMAISQIVSNVVTSNTVNQTLGALAARQDYSSCRGDHNTDFFNIIADGFLAKDEAARKDAKTRLAAWRAAPDTCKVFLGR